ncbi:MAG: cytochrome P450 [Luminiphilus sp.]|nr:cytochrome P450 [Luminiphilus sp.]
MTVVDSNDAPVPSTVMEVDLLDSEHIQCPYALYEELQEHSGRGKDPNLGWIVSKYQDLVALAKNTELFSSSITEDGQGPRHMGVGTDSVPEDVEAIFTEAHTMVNALFTADPPIHTRHRKLVSKALSTTKIRALEPRIRKVTEALIESFFERGVVDILPEFAVPLPVMVIADILGVDKSDLWTFKRWGDLMISGNIDVLTHNQRLEVARAVVDFHAYFLPRIQQRRQQPTDDLLSDLVNAEIDGEPALRDEELLPIIDQILLAGHETTTNLITNGLVILCRRPELLARLTDDTAVVPAFVEEVLRWDPPIHCTYRRTTRNSNLGDVAISEGDMVIPLWAGANRDPAVFPQPERFDIDRENVRAHMGFGYGPHFCVGAELARLEARVAFETLLARLPGLALSESESDLTRLPSFASHGFQRVVLTFKPADSETVDPLKENGVPNDAVC